ncbi:MAG: DUF305 domain-containing protein [Candidatus Nanopelagicaceae bacterium]|nr:DUF305 domain-containing protein [Candidatus Nanopelagicaceae bacterium]
MKKIALVLALFLPLALPQPLFANTHSSQLSNLGMNEIMFAQSMIPHHDQAVELSKIALRNSSNSEVKKLASKIVTAQLKEIVQMKYWLKVNNVSAQMGHDMGMSGMLTSKQVSKLKSLKGAAFDKAFLQGMIDHHNGALEMLYLLRSTKNAEAKTLATNIRKAQSGEISKMENILAKIS